MNLIMMLLLLYKIIDSKFINNKKPRLPLCKTGLLETITILISAK